MDSDRQEHAEFQPTPQATTAERIGHTLADLAEPLTEQARTTAAQQKAAGAEQIGSIARAIHGAAGELEANMPQAREAEHRVEAADTAAPRTRGEGEA